jgi:putative ubiquitin-RnfH superfamily antitoxin RatB of RatAB toxin-antitoxin module
VSAAGAIEVEVVRAWPRRHASERLRLPAGATVADALAACTLPRTGVDAYAVFGERVQEATALRDGDRLELLAPLRLDPKEARRLRAARR